MLVTDALHIAFRADASVEIGSGHVMRCLTLAESLRQKGATSTFLCRPHQGHLLDLISQRGHEAIALPELSGDWVCEASSPPHASWLGTSWQQDAEDTLAVLAGRKFDWWVMDHYALDAGWQAAVKPAFCNLMVIDDLADRAHICDFLLDQNLGRTKEDYTGLLDPNTKTLIGPEYALLRPEFAQLRSESLDRRKIPQLRRILITMGGVDKTNMTCRLLDALDGGILADEIAITVVMGPHAPYLVEVRKRAEQMRRTTQVLVGVTNMARLMTDSDLAFGAAGSTVWERSCLGLPTVTVVLAENQIEVARALREIGASIVIDADNDVSSMVRELFDDPLTSKMSELTTRSSMICKGGGTSTVTDLMLSKSQDDTNANFFTR